MQITLNAAQRKLVAGLVKRGAYGSPEDAVAAGLEMLRDDPLDHLTPAQLKALKREIAIGVAQADRGDVKPWNPAETRALGEKLLAAAKKKAG